MSTIIGFGTGPAVPLPDDSAPPVAPADAQAPAQATPSPSPSPAPPPPPLFNLSFTGQGTALLLGLARPRGNFGDSEALFSQIAAALKTVQAETDDNEEFLRSSERLTASARAGTAVQQMLEVNGRIVGHEINIMTKNLRIETIDRELEPLNAEKTQLEGQVAQLQAQLEGLDGQIASLTGQIDTLNGQINTLNGQINTLNGQINTLNGQIGPLNGQIDALNGQIASWNIQIQGLQAQLANAADPNQRAQLQNQIGTLQSQVNGATAARNTLSGQRDTLVQNRDALVAERNGLESTRNGAITQRDSLSGQRTQLEGQRGTLAAQLTTAQGALDRVNDQIEALENEKSEAQASVNASQNAIVGLVGELTAIALGALIVGQALLGLLRGDGMRDSFETRTFIDDFEQTLSQILAQVSDLVQDKADTEFTTENAQVGLGDWRFEQGVGIAGRFGAMQPAQTMAIGFASAVASVIGTLRTLLDQADSLPQNPIALAEAGIARTRMLL